MADFWGMKKTSVGAKRVPQKVTLVTLVKGGYAG